MTDETKLFRPKAGWTDDQHAPVIYFDAAPACGVYHGVVGITLSVDLARAGDESGITVSHMASAYLRTSVAGAVALRNSLDQAILMATPTDKGAN